MTTAFVGKWRGLAAFALIAALVAGGLGWATRAALRVEREKRVQQAQAEHAAQVRGSVRLLDSQLAALLAAETSRPFNHYNAVCAPVQVLDGANVTLLPSPLLEDDLPPWELLHFQANSSGWTSPQAPTASQKKRLKGKGKPTPPPNATAERRALLAELGRDLPAQALLAHAKQPAGSSSLRDRTLLLALRQVEAANSGKEAPSPQLANSIDYLNRRRLQEANYTQNQRFEQRVARNPALAQIRGNGDELLTWPVPHLVPGPAVTAHVGPMTGAWLTTKSGREVLLYLRVVRIEQEEACQGVVLDAEALQGLLAEGVKDVLPNARVLPVREPSPDLLDRTLAALPLWLDPGPAPDPPDDLGWTPLRIGLAVAWGASLVALLAVAVGGWSLLDYSERRARFVSAVTHELRTPLTTLRLYLEMLLDGLVRDEKQREEYLRTLHAESERLTRLVNNVLDFSRLERQRPRLTVSPVGAGEVLEGVRAAWQGRCQDAGKELLVEAEPGLVLATDGELLQQVLGNLIDNACKYTRAAEDHRLWLRARRAGGQVCFEVEDRGPGVARAERRSVFRPFRRGAGADTTAGGVGLGLALAKRWAQLLGGALSLRAAEGTTGACFRVEVPVGQAPKAA